MPTKTRVLKWTIPVDDDDHPGGSSPIHVACVGEDHENVQLWTHASSVLSDIPARRYRVFGTGQPVPEGSSYVGTTLAADGALVWHLFDVTDIVHECTDINNIFGGYDCSCGKSWTTYHEEETRKPVWTPPTGPGSCPVHHKHSKRCEGEEEPEPKRKSKLRTSWRGY